MHILSPPLRQDFFYTPPSLVRPPPLEGYFQGWGVEVYKILPRMRTWHSVFGSVTWETGVRVGCCQRTPARKTPATSKSVRSWQELTKS